MTDALQPRSIANVDGDFEAIIAAFEANDRQLPAASPLHQLPAALGLPDDLVVALRKWIPGELIAYHDMPALAEGELRLMLMPRAWDYGHIIAFGENTWRWAAGDLIAFDARSFPHAITNLGDQNFYIVTLTGAFAEPAGGLSIKL